MRKDSAKKLGLASMLLLGLGLLLGCPTQKSIAEVQRDPNRWVDHDVAVTGTVRRGFGALVLGAYQLDDGTGTLWVWSNGRPIPPDGARVGVSGRIIPTLTLGTRSFATILREEHRRGGGYNN